MEPLVPQSSTPTVGSSPVTCTSPQSDEHSRRLAEVLEMAWGRLREMITGLSRIDLLIRRRFWAMAPLTTSWRSVTGAIRCGPRC